MEEQLRKLSERVAYLERKILGYEVVDRKEKIYVDDPEYKDCYLMQAGELQKGDYVVIEGRPCKIVEIATCK